VPEDQRLVDDEIADSAFLVEVNVRTAQPDRSDSHEDI
jgi:hypothetical protein